MTTVYMVRHAEAEGNLYRRVHGWYNSLITDNGYRQIAALRGRFADIHIDAVYSSDLFRNNDHRQSGSHLSHGLELHTDPGLREISLGAWEDKPWGELERCDAMNLIRFNHSSPDFRVEGGETFAQVQARLKGVGAPPGGGPPGPDDRPVLPRHRHPLPPGGTSCGGWDLGEMDGLGHSDNTAVTCLEVEGERTRTVFENDNSHLPDEISTLARQRWWKERDGTSGDANLWFRPLNLKKEGTVYRTARHEARAGCNGSAVPSRRGRVPEGRPALLKRAPERAVMCAMQRDETAGLLQMDLDRGAAEGVGYIPFLYMDPAHRRQGLGVQLLGQAVSTYRPLGRDRLRLCCAPDNGIAQRFCQKWLLVKMGEEPGARGPLDVLEKYIGFEAKES
ncbi:MAG: GNAT family N-acetyltransferase [Flavonifractor plautii]